MLLIKQNKYTIKDGAHHLNNTDIVYMVLSNIYIMYVILINDKIPQTEVK
jgi:hypothetical protein